MFITLARIIVPVMACLILAQECPAANSGDLEITSGFVKDSEDQYGRSAIHSDAIEYAMLKGTFTPPESGKEDGWTAIQADDKGYFAHEHLRGGYLYTEVALEEEAVYIMEARGHSFSYINGVLRGGDVYNYGWLRQPVKLKKGINRLLFRVSRGKMQVKFIRAAKELMFTNLDLTLPDLLLGESGFALGAIRIINATDKLQDRLVLTCKLGDQRTHTEVSRISPMITRKVGFAIPHDAQVEEGRQALTLYLYKGPAKDGVLLDEIEVNLTVKPPTAHHKLTFRSNIDGSIQYFGVSPGKTEEFEEGVSPALFLTCHGAGVEGAGQAQCYAAKDWGHVVAPTNRRPYGFDWEDWGRLDALEVLSLAEQRFGTDPRRTYLTGHSMGGHGTWYLGVNYPDRFAAIAPSAGWYSFYSYGGKKRLEEMTPIKEILSRSSHISDTLGMKDNYAHPGIYILHGDRDDNVPVTQARFMRDLLSEFHGDFAYYERPGAGHWWGNACCDWPQIFDFFSYHMLPEKKEVKEATFVTANPGVSSRFHWATIEAQQIPLAFSSIQITQDVEKRTFSGETDNVARLRLDLDQLQPGKQVTVTLDGGEPLVIDTPDARAFIWLARSDSGWQQIPQPSLDLKGPHRYGTFKDAFRNNMLLVYATGGNEAENAWAYNKARYDAESFYYRGNGSIEIVSDEDFDPAVEPDRGVILYGNADTHGDWHALLAGSPIQVYGDRMKMGDKILSGTDLGCYFVRPRPNSDTASVGVISGTGLEGMQSTNANMYFIAGSGFPDFMVFGSDMIDKHFDGVRAAGFFGMDWSLESGDCAFRD